MTSGADSRIIGVNGVELYVEEQGAGEPVVLVHGGTVTSASWQAIAPALAAHFHVITFDSRGHGRSTNPTGELSYRLIADDTVALIAALGLTRPFVGGWSDGGQVALEIGLHYPDAARALIVGAAYLDFQAPSAQAGLRSFFHAEEDGRIDFARFEREREGITSLQQYLHPGGTAQWQPLLQQTLDMWLAYPGLDREDLARIASPTLVILGDRDQFIDVQVGVDMYRGLPDAELAILPGHDHGRCMHEPATFVAAVTDFLDRHQPSSPMRLHP